LTFEGEIRFEDEVFGKVFIEWSTVSLNEEVERQVAEIRLLLGVSLLIPSFAGLGSVHRLVIRPLAIIHRRIRGLSNGYLSTALHPNLGDARL